VKHHAASPFQNMAKFMAELAQRSAPAARALKFSILTAAREVIRLMVLDVRARRSSDRQKCRSAPC
jgi:hypothetical protein